MTKILICGYGKIGARVAQLWQQRGAEIIALSRRNRIEKSHPRLSRAIRWTMYDLDRAHKNKPVPAAEIIYYFAPPPSEGESDVRIAAFFAALSAEQQMVSRHRILKKFILISTSAVYGDCSGDWVSETSATNPSLDRGKRRLDAECQAKAWCDKNDLSLVILRVPGIYGPGRLPIERLKKGLPVLRLSEAPYTNRIHSEDLAQICVLMAADDIQGIFNVNDGEPGNMSQYFFAVADACDLPRPLEIDLQQAQQQLSAGMLSYLSESRRMHNQKLRDQLNYEFIYPTLATGLAACGKNIPKTSKDNAT